MILLLHIGIAVLSMLVAGIAFLAPTRLKIRTSYILMALTLATGTYLVVVAPAHMVQACTVGVLYLAITASATVLARRKLSVVTE